MSGYTLALVEAFGPTIQGEGPQMGRVCSFVRFGACNLSCSWCDSAYTWDASRFPPREQITLLVPTDIDALIPSAPMLVITGGEPLMQQLRPGWEEFLELMKERFEFIAMETNGTILPTSTTQRYVDQFVVSPKLSGVEMLRPKQRADRAPAPGWENVAAKVDFKFVVSVPSDVDEALHIATASLIPLGNVWLMPEGVSSEALAERWGWVTEAAAHNGVNASHRLHVLSWGEVRGH